jgi:predicted 2-oxoglutarate/Fe(II)-dependent dioxygenase YbiX
MNNFGHIGLFPNLREPDETLAGCIDVFYDAWSNPSQTIKDLESALGKTDGKYSWKRATTVDPESDHHRTNLDAGVSFLATLGEPIMQKVHNQMYTLLLETTYPYIKKHTLPSLWHEYYNALKYSGGAEYHAHFDGGTESHRAVSAIVYLNDEFEGGEVEFVNFDIKIKPEPGMLLLFPSNYAYKHIAHPVTSGTKYAIVTWMHDQPMGIKER